MSQSKTPNPFTEPSGTSRELVKQLLEHVQRPYVYKVSDLQDPEYQLELAREVGQRELVEKLARAFKIGDNDGI